MTNANMRRAGGLALVICLALGAFTFLRGRPAEQDTVAPAPDSAMAADNMSAEDTVQDTTDAAPVAESVPEVASVDSAAPAATATGTSETASSTSTRRYRAGEDPDFAARMGWPVKVPTILPGSILPAKRIIAYYGNPLSKRMGVLGEYEPDEMLRRFDRAVAEWNAADPSTPVQPALHLIAVVAQAEAGVSGKYRTIMRDTLVEQVYRWAQSRDALLFVDIQVGHSDIRELLPRFDHFLSRPDVHLGVDPEFMMKTGHKPGAKIGTIDASDINYITAHLAELVKKHNLPPKVLVVHRFTRGMVTNSKDIQLRPEVQIVMHMDGWGAPWLKRDTYRDYIVREPVQYTGFKLFYHNDTKKGDPLMAPADLLKLHPTPLYIQYQ